MSLVILTEVEKKLLKKEMFSLDIGRMRYSLNI